MREIKFRAWSPIEKNMYSIAFPTWNGGVETWKNNKPQTETMEIESEGDTAPILLQYTGLKDKNGKEIYEGDILKFYAEDSFNFVEDKNGIYTIEYAVSAFVGVNEYDELDFGAYYTEEGRELLEVIGNIYENPELLRGNSIE